MRGEEVLPWKGHRKQKYATPVLYVPVVCIAVPDSPKPSEASEGAEYESTTSTPALTLWYKQVLIQYF